MNELERAIAFMDELDERSAGRIVPFSHGQAYVHERLPLVHDLNYLRVTEPGASAGQLVEEAERIQQPLGNRHRRVNFWNADEPRRLEGEFVDRGWEVQRFVVMVHRRPGDRGTGAEAREVDHDALEPVWADGIRSEPYGKDEEVVRQLVEHKRVTEQALPTRYFAAFVDGSVASFCDLYSSGGVGQVEAVLTLPEHRNRGLASAVVQKATAESVAAGNDLTFLVADADDWPKELYAKLGYDTVGRYARFLLKL